MSTITPTPQEQNIAEALEILREIGATAEAFTASDALRLACALQGLQAKLRTHTVIIAAVPTPHAPHSERI